MNNSLLTGSELRRFHEQLILPGIGAEGQQKIKLTKIAIIGVGGTGASALQYLSASGVGYMGIIDDSIVDDSNIQRQTLYGGADLGKLKTIISKQRIQTLFPHSEYELINLRLIQGNAQNILAKFDIVVDATNNSESGVIINDACIALNKPWVYCNVNGCDVTLSVFNYNNGPSLRCVNNECNKINLGTINTVYGFAGLFISTEIIKIITDLPSILSGKLLTFNCLDYSVREEKVVKNENNFSNFK